MIRIVTDSTSDLSAERAAQLGVEMLPLSVHFGEACYRDGVDITKGEFYEKLSRADKLPTTSQITPETFEAVFRRHIQAGDQVLGLFISSAMSGTCQSANIARSMVDEDNIAVPDTGTVTFGLGLLVETACLLRDQGLSLAELTDRITQLAPRVRLLAVVDTLKYLKMGGRISTATALVGGVLGISPIITIEDGLVASIGKARGRKAALAWIAKRMESEPPDTSLPVAFGHSNAPEVMADCMEAFKPQTQGAPLIVTCDIGAVVGTHVGPGAGGLAYYR